MVSNITMQVLILNKCTQATDRSRFVIQYIESNNLIFYLRWSLKENNKSFNTNSPYSIHSIEDSTLGLVYKYLYL